MWLTVFEVVVVILLAQVIKYYVMYREERAVWNSGKCRKCDLAWTRTVATEEGFRAYYCSCCRARCEVSFDLDGSAM